MSDGAVDGGSRLGEERDRGESKEEETYVVEENGWLEEGGGSGKVYRERERE